MGRRQLAETKRLIVYVLDTACATADPQRNPEGQIACLFDLSGEVVWGRLVGAVWDGVWGQ